MDDNELRLEYFREWHSNNNKHNNKQTQSAVKGPTYSSYNREYYLKNKEKYRIQHMRNRAKINAQRKLLYKRTYRNEDSLYKRPRFIYYRYKSSAKARGLSFQLTFEEFVDFWQKNCFYCGDPIQKIGLDRIDNSQGYSITNVCACCQYCNRMKMAMTKEFFLDKIAKINKNHNI